MTVDRYPYDIGTKPFKDWLEDLRLEDQRNSGWAFYRDDTYTEGSPFSISANTDTILQMNKDTVIETQLPYGQPTWLQEESPGPLLCAHRNGDCISVTLGFMVIPTNNNVGFDVWLEIGGSIGEVFRSTTRLARGNNVPQHLSTTWTMFQGSTWVQNGAQLMVNATHNCGLYGFELTVALLHKAR
jgi:hypothetical protein